LNKASLFQARSDRHFGARGHLGALMLGVATGGKIRHNALLQGRVSPPGTGAGGGADFAKKLMLDLRTKLEKQKTIDTEKREFCVEEIHENAREDNELLHGKEALEMRMETLEGQMRQLKKDISDLRDVVEELNNQMKRAGQNRENENHDFQVTLADQRASRELLEKALMVLKEVYGKPGTFLAQTERPDHGKPSLSLLQTSKTALSSRQPELPELNSSPDWLDIKSPAEEKPDEWHLDDTPSWMLPGATKQDESGVMVPEKVATNLVDESDMRDDAALSAPTAGFVEESQMSDERQPAGPMPKFGEYKKGKQSGGVLQLIEKIIFDTKEMEKEVIADEEYAQRDYQAFVKKTTASEELAQKDIIAKKSEYAKGEEDTVLMKEEHWSTDKQYRLVHDTGLKLHAECDFLVKNFYDIMKGHDEEIAGLMDSVAILSGANGGPR